LHDCAPSKTRELQYTTLQVACTLATITMTHAAGDYVFSITVARELKYL